MDVGCLCVVNKIILLYDGDIVLNEELSDIEIIFLYFAFDQFHFGAIFRIILFFSFHPLLPILWKKIVITVRFIFHMLNFSQMYALYFLSFDLVDVLN